MTIGRLEPMWPRRLLAEILGTFALVFVAAGADTMAEVSGGAISVAARAVAPGLMVGALIYAISDASGAHFNPAVSLAFALKGLFPVSWLAPYWVAQLAGALAAAIVLAVLFGPALAAGVSTPHVTAATALAIEALLSAILVTVILGTADRARIVGPNAAIAVGGTIALCGLIALPIEGASMNPARSIGPAVVAGRLADLWIYVLGPIVGAVLATVATTALHGAGTSGRAVHRGGARRVGPMNPSQASRSAQPRATNEPAPVSARSEVGRWFGRGLGLSAGALVVIAIAAGFLVAWRVLLLVFLAVLVGSALEPVVGRLRARLPRGLSILVVYVLFFAFAAVVGLVVIPSSLSQANELATAMPGLFDRAEAWAAGVQPEAMSANLRSIIEAARGALASGPPSAVRRRRGRAHRCRRPGLGRHDLRPDLLLDDRACPAPALRPEPPAGGPARRRAQHVERHRAPTRWLGPRPAVLMVAIGTMTGLACWLFGLPSPLLLGLLAGVAESCR